MILHRILLVSLLAAATSAAPTDPRSLDFLLANLTSLWDEVSQLKREVNFHVHDGQVDHAHDLDQALNEVEVLAHEHHVHHLKHPHEGHNEHHSPDMLQHLETAHGHDHHDDKDDHDHHHSHSSHGDHGSHSGHGRTRGSHDSEEDDSEEDDGPSSSARGRTHGLQDNCGDRGRTGGRGGVQANCGGNGGAGGSHDRHGGHRGHGDRGSHRGHGHESMGHDAHGSSHEEADSHEDTHDLHGLDLETAGHVKQDAHHYPADHYDRDAHTATREHAHSHGPDGHAVAPAPGVFVDTWDHAYCDLEPNSDLPESHVKGRVDISQRMDRKNGIFFDVDISGFDLGQSGRVYGVHVHENAASGHSCDSAGGFNRPSPAAIANPDVFGNEHAGNIGDLTVDDEGEIDHEISASIDVTFQEMVGKAIVVHSLGLGDGSSSMYKARLACCNIVRARGQGGRFIDPVLRPTVFGRGLH